MNEFLASFSRLLSEVILPNLKAVQVSQSEQIAANSRLENSIEEMRLHLEAQFAHLAAQLTACRAELAATRAILDAKREQSAFHAPTRPTLVH
jgi:dynactin complex subunit